MPISAGKQQNRETNATATLMLAKWLHNACVFTHMCMLCLNVSLACMFVRPAVIGQVLWHNSKLDVWNSSIPGRTSARDVVCVYVFVCVRAQAYIYQARFSFRSVAVAILTAHPVKIALPKRQCTGGQYAGKNIPDCAGFRMINIVLKIPQSRRALFDPKYACWQIAFWCLRLTWHRRCWAPGVVWIARQRTRGLSNISGRLKAL